VLDDNLAAVLIVAIVVVAWTVADIVRGVRGRS